ncbi:NAD(P)-binding domain-containing protein [Flavobacterium sp. NKUCC04_CG]|uniref:NAD(P)-binding domain-containing protein n=1 Tax=Flavobacterium sp. NKUCC04_CG TaxID=2842121 RepID=UPI001C5B6980|nr:NAD(P)-binding domain-containing protein [Flavobacterium sp. NKUCC04_CG]MBW3519213.1 NAD(P)-binding domain-containing protein [Flavobacterium sp. NKUCC04_CG]
MPNKNIYDVIVIGAGQAGLAISYLLTQHKINHIVFEKNTIGSSWKHQRWDSFKLNTPNWMNLLPGEDLAKELDKNAFISHLEFLNQLNEYVRINQLPVVENTEIVRLDQDTQNGLYFTVAKIATQEERWYSKQIVVASGLMNTSKIPEMAQNLPKSIQQLHSLDYKNPTQLNSKNILIVGNGQTGCQLAEELCKNHAVYLATSKVGRSPRRYLGRDMMDWMNQMGHMDHSSQDLQEQGSTPPTQPQVSGTGPYGHTISLQGLRKLGTTLVGRLYKMDNEYLYFDDSTATNIDFADRFSAHLKKQVDTYVNTHGIDFLPTDEIDHADLPDTEQPSTISYARLALTNIDTIIWATGFTSNFDWIQLPVIDKNQNPIHKNGITPLKGIYFMGFPWLRKRKSGIIFGIAEDAQAICDTIIENR